MQGDDTLLAFELWASSLFKGLAFTAEGRLCPRAFCTQQEKYLLLALYARAPNELCCCANVLTRRGERGAECFVKVRIM